MLAVQVQYWTLKETEKHNRATEDLGNRTLQETVRHNIVNEEETHRHNVATEDYYAGTLAETIRHNQQGEQLSLGSLQVARQNADTNLYSAKVQAAKVANDYALGLDANRIAEENMRVSQGQLEVKQQEADTAAKQAQLGFLQWATKTGIDQTNAESSRMTAEANTQNADTNALNAETNAKTLELNQNRFNWQKYVDLTHTTNESVRTATDLADTMLKYLTK